jgi:two-component system, cell cycle sensor histidine kinase and response regulator CckA
MMAVPPIRHETARIACSPIQSTMTTSDTDTANSTRPNDSHHAADAASLGTGEIWQVMLDHLAGRLSTDRETLEAQLLQVQKMEALGRLAGGVAHDFNNILTAILSWSESLLVSFPTHDPRRYVAEEIGRAARRATCLTGQLLAFSRPRPVSPQVIDLNQSVNELSLMLRRLVGSDVEVVTRLSPVPCLVRADPSQIDQLVLNLAINARDAMAAGGELTLELSHVSSASEDPAVRLRPGNYVRLAVRDTGTGMSAMTRARIFEPFFTTKGDGRGTGLGLATVYGIVMQQEGVITVESSPGAGSTFTIYLSRVDAVSAAARS